MVGTAGFGTISVFTAATTSVSSPSDGIARQGRGRREWRPQEERQREFALPADASATRGAVAVRTADGDTVTAGCTTADGVLHDMVRGGDG